MTERRERGERRAYVIVIITATVAKNPTALHIEMSPRELVVDDDDDNEGKRSRSSSRSQ